MNECFGRWNSLHFVSSYIQTFRVYNAVLHRTPPHALRITRTSHALPVTRTSVQLRMYSRLRDLVFLSPHIDPAYVLAKLPRGGLPEIQALMCERLGR